jgi:acyl transferase domain-containing protein
MVRMLTTCSNGRHSDNGITYPSVEGQASVMEAAHKLGHLDPASTAYIECHGTGTPTGDPVEVRAVSKAFRNRTQHQGPILIGSVRHNRTCCHDLALN